MLLAIENFEIQHMIYKNVPVKRCIDPRVKSTLKSMMSVLMPNNQNDLDIEDDNLVKAACRGDRTAFSKLIERHYMLIYRIAYKWCGNQEDAEDIAQDVSIKLANALDSYQFKSKFTTWLYRLTVNVAKDKLRQKNRKNGRELALPSYEDAQYKSSDISQEKSMILQEKLQLISELPEKLKDAVILVYWDGKTHGEAAEILECKESTISWRIHEARKQLSTKLEDQEKGESHG